MDETVQLEEALVSMNRATAQRIITASAALSVGALDGVVTGALERIGARWDRGELALSQVYMAGRICEQIMTQVEPAPRLATRGPRLAVAVLEDYHMLGERLVTSVLRAAGYLVVDYGRVTVDELLERVCNDAIDVVMISVLMFPSALRVRAVVDGLAARGSGAKVVVGGAPFRFDPQLAEKVGAHYVGRTASDALQIAAELSRGQ